jgi:hypothetical protein
VAKNPLLDLLNTGFDTQQWLNRLQMSPRKLGFWTFSNLSVNNKKGMQGGLGWDLV